MIYFAYIFITIDISKCNSYIVIEFYLLTHEFDNILCVKHIEYVYEMWVFPPLTSEWMWVYIQWNGDSLSKRPKNESL